MQKHKIYVHSKGERYGIPGMYIKTIKRVLKTKQVGNFNPIFCLYNTKEYLVQSHLGDLSDPFRRQKNYFQWLFIEI